MMEFERLGDGGFPPDHEPCAMARPARDRDLGFGILSFEISVAHRPPASWTLSELGLKNCLGESRFCLGLLPIYRPRLPRIPPAAGTS